ncbi:hypothetical protein PR003_g2429 [Phytophthora rubi]|uniref:Uncharacterized protein n=1 Tax=Phytophthora rubi TaxID=129364 RepID=A0A6A4FSR0_9STRA|nr:hypothetical protein PR003_g2429 [Phytophthora rubi]
MSSGHTALTYNGVPQKDLVAEVRRFPLPRDHVGRLRDAQVASRPRGTAVGGNTVSTYPNDDDDALFLYMRSSRTPRSTAAQQGQRFRDAKEKLLRIPTARSYVTFMTDGSNECLACGQRFANLNKGKLVIVKRFINCPLYL